jgi:hypothetical protein
MANIPNQISIIGEKNLPTSLVPNCCMNKYKQNTYNDGYCVDFRIIGFNPLNSEETEIGV